MEPVGGAPAVCRLAQPASKPTLALVAVLKRFVVAEDSMRPTLVPGDGLLALRTRRPRIGTICVLRSPASPSTWLVKRVAGVAGDAVHVDGRAWHVGPDEVFVLSDDRRVTVADSRRFGPVRADELYRVVLRLPARRRRG